MEAKREGDQKDKAEEKWKTTEISLEASILYLREKTNKLAFESEKANNLEGMKDFITESNVLKKSAIEKEMQVANLNKTINNLGKELSDN